MNYPNPPWLLNGFAFQTFQLSPVSEARQYVPALFDIVSVLPGKTPSGLYIAKYETGSTLIYSELILIRALVQYQSKIGFWCSKIFVDHPLSLQGGQSIWQLPKQLADFKWQGNDQVTILTEEGASINIGFYYRSKIASKLGIRLSFSVPLLTESKHHVYFSKMKISAKIKLGRTNIFLPEKAETSLFSCYYEALKVMATAPHQQMEK
jgi:acetoacetate decarboxylase